MGSKLRGHGCYMLRRAIWIAQPKRIRLPVPPTNFLCKWLAPLQSQSNRHSIVRVDQGSEFISRDLDLWAYQKSVELDFSRPGKPTDNAFIESFNGKFRAECLNAHWFLTLDDARSKMEDSRKDYNNVRPHSAIGNKPPAALAKSVLVPSMHKAEQPGKTPAG